MTQLMEEDFIYWRHPSVPGIKVEEITGGERYKDATWLEMAQQVYCENGRDSYREIGHYPNGAPFLFGDSSRISISHCKGMYVVATLPSTPEVDLGEFSERAALGVDAERADREQVLRIRERFMSARDLETVSAEDVEQNVLVWTIKEAAFKAVLGVAPDFREEIVIEKMPRLAPPVPVFDAAEYGLPKGTKVVPADFFGSVVVRTNSKEEMKVDSIKLEIYSYRSDDHIITLAYAPRCAKFTKSV